ncbi:MAG: hypothetical protein VX438_17355 [Planctomycetota bacterium]|nr:hypothetical protein [Planctomycetota bacterium]
MRFHKKCPIPVLFLILTTLETACSQQGSSQTSLKFQVAYPQSLQVGVAQKWLAHISAAGADGIRLVVNPDEEIRLVENQFKSKSIINVYAKINAKQQLVVPGGSFSLSDTGELKRWIQKIKNLKSIDSDAKKVAFGLTAKQLVDVYEQLGKPYPKLTRDQKISDVVRTIRAQIGFKIGADQFALDALAEDTKVLEELKGLSCGTVIAAVTRPLGLVMIVGSEGKQFSLVESKKVDEHWPVGWPLQDRPSKVAPILFEQTEVEVGGIPLNQVLIAIEAKTKVPFIYDQNSMARQGIKMQKIAVNIGRSKTYYQKIIRLCLNQSKPRLTAELRVDESGHPFLWISTSGKK